jgi:hypothetical protein
MHLICQAMEKLVRSDSRNHGNIFYTQKPRLPSLSSTSAAIDRGAQQTWTRLRQSRAVKRLNRRTPRGLVLQAKSVIVAGQERSNVTVSNDSKFQWLANRIKHLLS